jgi:isoleucyl-tRNA synthetase
VRSVNGEAAFSVHLSDWPKVNEELLDEKLTNETHLVMRIVGLGRAAREKAQIKVRQPLGAMFVRVADRDEEEALLRLSWQVLEELNIKQLHLMSDDSNMLAYTLKPQVKGLGPKYGPLVQKILAAFKALDAHGAQEAARALNETGKLRFTIDGHQIELTPDEIEVVATARPGFVAAEDRGYVVALETTITPELREEGLVRDLTHYVQDMRKRAGFNIVEPAYSQTRRRLGGRTPLCGIGVTSMIEVMVRPAACSERIAASRPEPGPLTRTSICRRPCSIALRAAASAATCAA